MPRAHRRGAPPGPSRVVLASARRRRGAATMGDSESSLFSFFFYVLFVYPATNWLLKPGRFSRTKGLTYAISLLVAIAAVQTGPEIKEQGPNYYPRMKVGRAPTALA